MTAMSRFFDAILLFLGVVLGLLGLMLFGSWFLRWILGW